MMGWTPDVSPKPATAQTIRALIEKLQSEFTPCHERDNFITALDNALDCGEQYSKFLQQKERAYFEEDVDGTYPSPIISGGEILWQTYPTGHDDIPF